MSSCGGKSTVTSLDFQWFFYISDNIDFCPPILFCFWVFTQNRHWLKIDGILAFFWKELSSLFYPSFSLRRQGQFFAVKRELLLLCAVETISIAHSFLFQSSDQKTLKTFRKPKQRKGYLKNIWKMEINGRFSSCLSVHFCNLLAGKTLWIF